ncbi:MAG: U32 family peptidase [Oscillospiraceae bacterium]|nr:U32 family peptidase [Oscillospiraceae bacterium]
MRLPELLSPAGDLDRVHTALLYGADAVYLAGRLLSMRAKAVSFQDADLGQAIRLIHDQGKKAYITCNALPRENELELLPDYFSFLQELGADALILADLGLLRMAERYAPKCARHVSTQFGVRNSETASFLYDLGADTVVLARECSLDEIRNIRVHCPAELRLEAFVHGAMCVSFSGRCLLSNYLTGRDSNHGECAQPCRWKYHLVEETRPGKYMEISESDGTFILNAEDLCMIEHLADLREAGIDSFKIEGRMKSAYYTGAVTNAYRMALDALGRGEPPAIGTIQECEAVSHRPYCTGFYYGQPQQYYSDSLYHSTAEVSAIVVSCDEDGMALLKQCNKIKTGDSLELLLPGTDGVPFTAESLWDEQGERIADTRHAEMRYRMQLPEYAPPYTLVRTARSSGAS